METYSYQKSQRRKRLEKFVRAIIKFHLTHQNLILLILGLIFAYLLFKLKMLYDLTLSLAQFGYWSAFVLGFLFSFGSFTVPAATAIFILSSQFNPFLIAFVAATAAAVSNFLIYKFVKEELLNEMKNVLAKDFRFDMFKLEERITKSIHRSKFLKSFIPTLSGILVSLPLPTEFFVSVLWTIARYNTKEVLFYSFIFSFIGILNIALFSHAIS